MGTVEDKARNKNMTLVVEQGSSFSPKGQGILAFAYSCVAFVVLVLPESVISSSDTLSHISQSSITSSLGLFVGSGLCHSQYIRRRIWSKLQVRGDCVPHLGHGTSLFDVAL